MGGDRAVKLGPVNHMESRALYVLVALGCQHQRSVIKPHTFAGMWKVTPKYAFDIQIQYVTDYYTPRNILKHLL